MQSRKQPVAIRLLDLDTYKKLGDIRRIPQDRAGYQVVNYMSKKYQLRGGIRTDLFIAVNNPLHKI